MAMSVKERVAAHRARKRQENLKQTAPDWGHVALHLNRMPAKLKRQLCGQTVTPKEPDRVLKRSTVTPKRNEPDIYEPTQEEMDTLYEDITLLVAPSHMTDLGEFGVRSLTADYTPLKKMVDSLPKAMSKKALTAFIRLLKYQRKFFQYELNRKVGLEIPKAIKDGHASLAGREKKLEEEQRKLVAQRHGFPAVLTDAQCKFLKGVLHPDKLPPGADEATVKKWTRGFRLINKAL
jgi:hypothetical protein